MLPKIDGRRYACALFNVAHGAPCVADCKYRTEASLSALSSTDSLIFVGPVTVPFLFHDYASQPPPSCRPSLLCRLFTDYSGGYRLKLPPFLALCGLLLMLVVYARSVGDRSSQQHLRYSQSQWVLASCVVHRLLSRFI